MECNLTIFTPTYNRANDLKNVYKSLIVQKNKNFRWCVVDDGSTDDTEKIINEFEKLNKISIKYIKKSNGGKHTAFNSFLDIVDTEYCIISLDSDDILTDDAIEIIQDDIKKLKNEVGIVYLKEVTNLDTFKYPINELKGLSLKDAICNNLYNTECIFVFKSEYLKQFRFPIVDGEKFFTEAYLYLQMKEKMLWTNKTIEKGTYLNDGLTKNTTKLFVKYPNSWLLYNEIRMIESKKMFKRIRYTIYFISFCILANRKDKLKKYGYKVKILYPLGFVGALYLKKKGGNL